MDTLQRARRHAVGRRFATLKINKSDSGKGKNEIHVCDNMEFFMYNASRLANAIDFIYIDPPYNTQNSFSYNDKRSPEEWVAFMDLRLLQAKNVLTEDGVLFISIDDSSLYELKILCDKIFGKENFVGTFITKQAERSNAKHINITHEYVVCYAKNKNKLQKFSVLRIDNPEDGEMIKDLYNVVKVNLNKGTNEAEKMLKQKINEYCKKWSITWLKNYSHVDADGEIFFAKDLSVPGEPNEIVLPCTK
jgi:adenine-specific DNA-methyltransferase